MATFTTTAGTVTVELTDADTTDHGWIGQTLRQRPRGDKLRLILDLSRITSDYIGSELIGLMVSCYAHLVKQKGWVMVIRANSPAAQQLQRMNLQLLPGLAVEDLLTEAMLHHVTI